jgi:hypothetical protein
MKEYCTLVTSDVSRGNDWPKYSRMPQPNVTTPMYPESQLHHLMRKGWSVYDATALSKLTRIEGTEEVVLFAFIMEREIPAENGKAVYER